MLAFALATAAIYAGVLRGPFVFDDLNIERLALLRIHRLSEIGALLAAPGIPRKVGMASFALNVYAGGPEPFGFHLVNLVLHALNGALLFALAFRLLARLPRGREEPAWALRTAALGAALWLAHPVQTQAVSYVWQRFTSLSSFFFLGSLLAFVDARTHARPRWPLYAASAACGLLALGTKENAATLPLFILLIERLFLREGPRRTGKRTVYAALGLVALFLAIAAVFLGPRFLRLMEADYQRRGFTPVERLLTEARVVVYYLGLLLYPRPSRLNVDYDYPLSTSLLRPPTTLLCLAAIAAALAFAFRRLDRRPGLAFAILWFFGNLAIESTVIPLDLVHEHRLYLPSMGALVLLAAALLGSPLHEKAKGAVSLALILVLGAWSIERNRLWADPVLLWQDSARKSPDKARVHGNLGKAYVDRGDDARAQAEFERAIRLDPGLIGAYNNLALIYLERLDEPASARSVLETALARRPDDLDTRMNLGVACLRLGDFRPAAAHLEAALALDAAKGPQSFCNLGLAYLGLGDHGKAFKTVEQGLARWPGEPSLVALLEQARRLNDAKPRP